MNFSQNKRIESLNNPEYKFLVSLKKNRNRKTSNKTICEGFRENNHLIKSEFLIDTLYICEEYFIGENNASLIKKFQDKNIRIVTVSEKVFQNISYRDRPDGLISLVKYENNELNNDIKGPILIPDKIEKPGNLGTMIRTARSFGINNVILSDKITDIYNPNVIRSSIGHVFSMNISSGSHVEIIDFLLKKNYEILLLDPEGELELTNYKPSFNFALVVGSEQFGISKEWFVPESKQLRIRSTNDVDSINASTAAAIGMWELTK